MNTAFRNVLAVISLVAVAGCGDVDPAVTAAAVAADLKEFSEFYDSENELRKAFAELVPERDGQAPTVIRIKPNAKCQRADVERLLGFALTNISEARGLKNVAYVADDGGWLVYPNGVPSSSLH